ncbi:hypothetical protein [uncultured Endozoicomonas sp.]|uniref:hypothetical protein n=1 Tax=uncultured Endozoicomonas sp. TaxID=432652 RepID=UPI00262C3E5B|nr:hypothetical protein [uncultured Endozoicomonas sp.]
MNIKTLYPIAAACLLAIAGCSPIPRATSVDQTAQIKLQSAQHWGVIADHLAGQIMTNAKLSSQPVYIEQTKNNSVFSKVFGQQVSSALVKRGAMVMTSSTTPLSMELDVQIVRHPGDRDSGSNFEATSKVGFLWALMEFGDEVSSVAEGFALSVIPVTAAYDIGKMLPTKTNTEVVVTTRIVDGFQIRFSETHSYYVPDLAMRHYKESAIVNMTDKDSSGVNK